MEDDLYPDISDTPRPTMKDRLPRPHRYLYVPSHWQYILFPLAIALALGIPSVAFFMHQSSVHNRSKPHVDLPNIPASILTTQATTPNSATQVSAPNATPNSATQTPASNVNSDSATQTLTPNTNPKSASQAPTPTPRPTPVPAPKTYSEQEGHNGANTFTNPYNASGMGTKISAAAWVQVSCKVYAPAIQSANPDGYWYLIASSPWNKAYYAVANTFMNGDPWNGPYTHNTDFNVPNC